MGLKATSPIAPASYGPVLRDNYNSWNSATASICAIELVFAWHEVSKTAKLSFWNVKIGWISEIYIHGALRLFRIAFSSDYWNFTHFWKSVNQICRIEFRFFLNNGEKNDVHRLYPITKIEHNLYAVKQTEIYFERPHHNLRRCSNNAKISRNTIFT